MAIALDNKFATMEGTRDEDFELDDDFNYAKEEEERLLAGEPTTTTSPIKNRSSWRRWSLNRRSIVTLSIVVLLGFTAFIISIIFLNHPKTTSTGQQCYDATGGYQCHPAISHYWGQYSPFFSLAEQEAEISPAIPSGCSVSFVQVLARHGARYPTASRSEKYAKLVEKIQKTTTKYNDSYTLLKDYKYKLGANDMTTFGEQQLIDLGTTFYNRYEQLARENIPFVRASGSDRVIVSGEMFSRGYNAAKKLDPDSNKTQLPSKVDLVIPEGHQWNNTLSTGTCEGFSKESRVKRALKTFLKHFARTIMKRIVANMHGVDIKIHEVPLLMDLCPFETVAQNQAKIETISPLCELFTHEEWQQYDYYNTLGKYYGYGGGNPLGSTRGIGYVNEVVARMTKIVPVKDHTSVNHTLDSDPATFPLDTALYVDFTHDNAMASIFDAFGLYNTTDSLSMEHVQPTNETRGYAASWLVPFGARAYIEMMQCPSPSARSDSDEPLVRFLINDRVVPLQGCDVDALGRCRLNDWINGLQFIRDGGLWDDNCPKTDDVDPLDLDDDE